MSTSRGSFNRPAGEPYRDGARWVARYYDRAGVRRKATGKTVTEALARRDAALAGVDRAETVGAFLDWWVTVHLERRVRAGRIQPGTADGYGRWLRHVPAWLRQLPLVDVGVEDIETWMDELERATSAKTGRPLSRRSLQAAHASLRLAFSQAVRTGRIERNPCELVSAPTPKPSRKAVLEPGQVPAFVEACGSERLGGMWLVALAAGLRPGEAAAIPVTAVDVDAGTVAIRRSLRRERRQWVWGPTKTHAEATYRLPPFAVEAVRRRLADRDLERSLAGGVWRDAELVDEHGAPVTVPLLWCREDGGPLAPNVAARALARICARAGLPRLTPHALRHSAASLLIAEGHDLATVQKLLRHTRHAVTSDLYVHMVEDVQVAHAEALQRLAGPASGPIDRSTGGGRGT